MKEEFQLSVSNHGFGTVYVNLPLGTYESEREMLLALLDAKPPRGVRPDLPKVYLLSGQANLAARFSVDDFRGILGLGYPAQASSAFVHNWVYSVCYDLPPVLLSVHEAMGAEGVIAPAALPAASDAATLRFIVHLRVLRSFYAGNPIDAEIHLLLHLRSLFATIDISIETSIGWSDLIINGNVDASRFSELLNILINVNTLKAGTDADNLMPLFTRTLTLFGYAWDGNPRSVPRAESGFKALMFVRSLPGSLDNVQKILKARLPGMHVSIVDGKLDLVGQLDAPDADFFLNHVQLVERDGAKWIGKLETHLLFGADHVDRSDTALILPGLRLRKCNCKEGFADVQLLPAIPAVLQHAVRDLLYLMRAALRDPTNCCDIRPAIHACVTNLLSLQRTLREALAKLSALRLRSGSPGDHARRTSDSEVASVTNRVTAALTGIERWVLLSERVLRQRTIGSFEEFLGQSDRAVFYRGGAQKMLLLADCLMNEFYRTVAPTLGSCARGAERNVPIFASVYDAVDKIESETSLGLVRVPAQQVFTLPIVLPDLWHEVGAYCFFNCFDDRERNGVWNGGRDVGLSRTVATPDSDGESALYSDSADHFGDIVVCVYGFDCRFRQFLISTLQRFFDSTAEHLDLVRETLLASVVLRLMVVSELLRVAQNECEVATQVVVKRIYKHVVAFLPRYREHFNANVWGLATKAWEDDKQRAKFAAIVGMAPIGEILRRSTSREHESLVGQDLTCAVPRFDVSESLNDRFYQLHWAIEWSRASAVAKAFGAMAALGRGAVLEYHRRLAQEDEALGGAVQGEEGVRHITFPPVDI